MSRMGPDLSGMIPLDALEAQAAGVRRLSAGVADLAGTAENMLAGMQEVRDAGQWAEARDGLYRFEQDVMRELDSAGAADDLQARWKKALAAFLPAGKNVRSGEGARGGGAGKSGRCRKHLPGKDVPSWPGGAGAPFLVRKRGVCRGAGGCRTGGTQD